MGDQNSYTTLELIKKGDKETLETIYKENRKRFIYFARKQGLIPEDAEDVYQNSIIAFIENISSGKIQTLQSSVSTYLFGIGKKLIQYQIRLNTRKKNSPEIKISNNKLNFI